MTDTKNTVSDELLADWRKGLRNYWDEDECPSWPVVETHVDALFQSLRASIPGGVGVKEDDAIELQWRDLALQFDGHRIDALEMLRFAVRSIEEYATVRDIMREPLASIKAFLAKPPLSGEAVLANRLSALDLSPAEGGQKAALPERCPHCNMHWGYNPPAFVAGTDQVRCIECKTVYAAPSNPVISDEMVERAGKALAQEIRNQEPAWTEDYDEGEYLIVSPSGDYFAIDVAARAVLTAALSVKPQSGENR